MSTTITLCDPVKNAGGETVTEITLRDPGYLDYTQIGPPAVLVTFDGGGRLVQDMPTIINAWIERLADVGPDVLQQLSLADTIALRDALVGMFPLPQKKHTAEPDGPAPQNVFTSATAH
jgi:hypothetical protein